MESKVFGTANVVGSELLATMPSLLNNAIQDVTRRIVDKVIGELEKGESICSLQTVEQNQFNNLNSVEIRRTVKIQRLVRCRECAHCFVEGFVHERNICKKHPELGNVPDDWFCADGGMEVQE